eukprot:g34203.t1
MKSFLLSEWPHFAYRYLETVRKGANQSASKPKALASRRIAQGIFPMAAALWSQLWPMGVLLLIVGFMDVTRAQSCAGRAADIMCVSPCTGTTCGVRQNYNLVSDLTTLGLASAGRPFTYPRETVPAGTTFTGAQLKTVVNVLDCQGKASFKQPAGWKICPVGSEPASNYTVQDIADYNACDMLCGYCDTSLDTRCLWKDSAGVKYYIRQCHFLGNVPIAPCQKCRCDDDCRGDGQTIPYTCCDDYEDTCGGPKITGITVPQSDRPTSGGNLVTIAGKGFAEGRAHASRKGKVFFNPQGSYVEITDKLVSWSDETIVLRLTNVSGFGGGRRFRVEEAPIPWLNGVSIPMLNASKRRTVSASDTQLYDYNLPSNLILKPRNGPTDGKSPAGGVTNLKITLTGRDFSVAKKVFWNGQEVNYSSWTDTSSGSQIILDAQPGTGTALIKVVAHTDAGSEYSITDSFGYDGPYILSFSSASAGNALTITGANFGNSTTGVSLKIGNKNCNITNITHTRIVCTLPTGSGAAQRVQLSVSGQNAPETTFAYPLPVLSLIDPVDSASTQVDKLVNLLTITGQHFGLGPSDQSASYVRFGNLPSGEQRKCNNESVCNVISWNNTRIVLWVPEGPGVSSTHPIQVYAGDSADLQSSAQRFFRYAKPFITSVSPQRGSPLGATVTVQGGNFGTNGTAFITFGYSPGDLSITGNCKRLSQTHTQVICNTPSGVGTVPVYATVSFDLTQWSTSISEVASSYSYASALVFGVTPQDASPPTTGHLPSSPYSVTVDGLNLGNSSDAGWNLDPPLSYVEIGGRRCPIVSWTDSRIVCQLPAGSGTGLSVVMVSAGYQAPHNLTFSYGRPSVSSITPTRTGATQGFEITVSGRNFGPLSPAAEAVTVGGQRASYLISWSDTSFVMGVPAGQGENVPLQISVGGQNLVSPELLSYQRPTISGWDGSGQGAGNTNGDDTFNKVVIQGTSFGAQRGTVSIGGTPVRSIISWTHTAIEVNHGPGSGRDQPIVVRCAGTNFTATTPPGAGFNFQPPQLTSLLPPPIDSSSWTKGGTIITIVGRNFGVLGQSIVEIGTGRPCQVTGGVDHYELYCRTPAGQGTLSLKVTTQGQQSATLPFSYRAPVLYSIESAAGYPTVGAVSVTVLGESLGTSGGQVTLVTEGSVLQIAVASQNHTYLIFTLPPGSGQREVQVAVGGVENTNVNPLTGAQVPALFLTYNAPLLTSVSPVSVDTRGNTVLVISGSNFGSSTSPSSVSVTLGSFGACTVLTVNQTVITCLTPPGQGQDSVTVEVQSLVSAATSDPNLQLKYAPPVLTAVSVSGNSLPTTGGTYLALQGSNFGLFGSPSRKVLIEQDELQCVEAPAGTHLFANCSMPAGVGNVTVKLTVGGQVSNVLYIVYDGPNISSLVAPATGVSTAGGSLLVVRGSNFGAEVHAYSGLVRKVTVGGLNCPVVSWNNTAITCSVPPGQGVGKVVVVTVGSLSSPSHANTFLSYDPPSLSVSPASPLSPSSGPTEGGISLGLFGKNFGSGGRVRLVGRRNFSSQETVAVDCPINAADSADFAVICALPAWDYAYATTNGRVLVQYDVAGQALVGPAVYLTLEPPSTPTLTPSYGSTSGGSLQPAVGDAIVATGSSFGSMVGTVTVGGVAAIVATWSHTRVVFWHPAGTGDGKPVYITAADGRANSQPAYFNYLNSQLLSVSPLVAPTGPVDTNLTIIGRSLGSKATTQVTINSLPCLVLVIETGTTDKLVCTIPKGQGSNLPIRVLIDGVSREYVSKFSYAVPTLSAFAPSSPGPTTGGGNLTVSGASLGLSGYVLVGDKVCTTLSHNHTTVTCRLPQGQGLNLAVQLVLNTNPEVRSSNSLSYSYLAPSVSSTSPSYLPTKGGTELLVYGANFGIGVPSSVLVLLGGEECTLKAGSLSHTNLTCIVPEYTQPVSSASLTIPVKAQLGLQSSSDPVFVQYSRPRITSVSLLADQTAGGQLTTIQGLNFGTAPSVLIGDNACPIISGGLTAHTKIICRIPSSQGTMLPLTVSNGLVSDNYFNFSYDPPAISTVSPTRGPTRGSTSVSERLTITGSSFGLGGTVRVGGVLCSGCTWGHSQVICPLPAGQGADLAVTLTVTGRPTASWAGTFSYDAPVISVLSRPQTNPTEGDTPALRRVLVILGSNFGLSGSVTVGGSNCPLVDGAYSHIRIECYIPPGVGSVSVVVTVLSRSSLPKTYSYDAPVLTSLFPATGPTTADFDLTISGRNFGPPGLPASVTVVGVEMQVGSATQLIACPVYPQHSNHTRLVCDFPAGFGSGLPVSVTVAGVASATKLSFSFDPPQLTRVQGCPENTDCCTKGCKIDVSESLLITGANFGPVGTLDNSQEFVANLACPSVVCVNDLPCFNVVQLSHTQISCKAPNRTAGLGVEVRVQVGLRSVSRPYLSYLAPTIYPASVALVCGAPPCQTGRVLLASTAGGEQITFGGDGFGTSTDLLQVEYGLLDQAFAVVEGTLRNCTVNAVSSQQVTCTTAAGVGKDLAFRVKVKNPVLGGVVQFSEWTNVSLASISYPPPQIINTTLRFASSSAYQSSLIGTESQGEALKFNARNFGLVSDARLISITYGPAGGPYSFQASAIELDANHEGSLRFLTSQGLGGPFVFRLQVLNQFVVGTDTYNYPIPPIVDKVSGCSSDPNNVNATVNCPTAGQVTLTITGSNFTTDKTTVKIGVETCGDLLFVSSTELRCTLPAGSGLNRLVSVTTARLSSAPKQLLSYSLPNMTAIAGCPFPSAATFGRITEQCPRSGGTILTLTGTNFGPANALVIVSGIAVSVTHNQTNPHTRVTFTLPRGEGLERSVVFIQGNGAAAVESLLLSYLPCQPTSRESNDGTLACPSCLPGRYSDVEGLAECKICELGYYAPAGGMSECLPCNLGKIGSSLEASSCDTCTAGKFSGGQARTACTECAVGRATPANESSACAKCVPGRYEDIPGQSFCQNCTQGRAAPGSGSISCDICSPGYAAKASSPSCIPCLEGFHQSKPEQATCEECELGSAASVTGLANCLLCTAGYFSNDTGLETCLPCPAGKKSSPTAGTGAQACTPCLEGSYIPIEAQATCLLCPKGKFGNTVGAVDCAKCLTGRHANKTGLTSCDFCPAGKHAPFNETVDCLDCTAGRVSRSPGGSSCEPCEKGYFSSSPGQATCLPCEPGTVSVSAGQPVCRPCTSGKYANASASTECRLCPEGTFSRQQSAVGPTSCRACEPGYFAASPGGQDQCLPCPVGTFQNASRAAGCLACPAGRYTGMPGQSACLPCNPGFFAVGNAFSCSPCPRGTYSGALADSCQTCPEGFMGPQAGSPQCSSCSPGYFIGVEGASDCLPCAKGKHSSVFNATICSDCPVGFVAISDRQSSCTPCEPGTYAPVDGLAVCIDCPLGRASNLYHATTCARCVTGSFANRLGMTACRTCLPGYFAESNETVECAPCPAGLFANASGMDFCLSCPEGRFGGLPGKAVCELCEPGRYTSSFAQVECSLCAAGYAVAEYGKTSCPPCAKGFAQPRAGQGNCTACENGTVATRTGLLVCSKCVVGRYSNTTHGAGLSCLLCQPGRYQPDQGQGNCQICPAGRAQDQDGQASCNLCSTGFWSPTDGLGECLPCQPGYWSGVAPEGVKVCTPCAAGFFSSDLGQVSCRACPSGKASNQTSQSACPSCPAGRIQVASGQRECNACPEGRYAAFNEESGSAQCLGCGQGTYAPAASSACFACAAGFHQPDSEQRECIPCAAGKYADATGQANCLECPSGTYNNNSLFLRTNCTACAPGYYQDSTAQTACLPCGPGYATEEAGQITCFACGPGQFQNSSAQAGCLPCRPGRASASPATENCAACLPGSFQTEEGALTCTACPAGSASNASARATACPVCQDGKYQSAAGQQACLSCVAGKYITGQGQTSCLQCSPGRYSNSSQAVDCLPCPAGFSADSPGNSQCHPCDPGRAQDTAGALECALCGPGRYNNVTGQQRCLPCAPGFIQENSGQKACVSCPPATFTSNEGQTFCIRCPKGRANDQYGQEQCKPCAPGKSGPATSTGLSECAACERGRFQLYPGKSECEACPVGKYSNQTEQIDCLSCPPGSYGPTTALSTCPLCEAGFYNSKEGQFSCQPAPAGSYVPARNASAFLPCAAGTQQPAQGKSSCLACGLGENQPFQGQHFCVECPAGRHAQTGGLPECELCPVGRFTGEVGSTGECTMCDVGKYQAAAGQSSCRDCPIGRFGNTTQLSECFPCPPGYVTNATGKTECTACDPGQANSLSGQSQCNACKPGRASDAYGTPECPACPGGKVTQLSGQLACDACPDATYSVSTLQCAACETGRFGNGTGAERCAACPGGRFQNETGKVFCYKCGIAEYSNPGALFCQLCPSGRASDRPDVGECPDCRPGFYQDEFGKTGCKTCLEGHYQKFAGQKICDECPAGTFSDDIGVVNCTLCDYGKHQNETGQQSCTECPVGYYADTKGLANCVECPPGRFGNASGLRECFKCPRAFQQEQAGQQGCLACPAGYYGPEGTHGVCEPCGHGYASSVTPTFSCAPCGPGTFTDRLGSLECRPCAPGFYTNEDASSDCLGCPSGSFTSANGSRVCDLCENGTYVSYPQATSCLLCPPGTVSGQEGARLCLPCVAGYFTNISGQLECSLCSAGTFSYTGRSNCSACEAGRTGTLLRQSCDNCPAGRFGQGAGSDDCIDCEPGEYQPLTGRSSCLQCELGRARLLEGGKECTACRVGFFANETGLGECFPCPQGWHQNRTGARNCTACSAGTYAERSSQVDCLLCTPGRYGNVSKMSSCVQCEAGRYNDKYGKSSCDSCQPGFYSPAPGAQECVPCKPGFADSRSGQRLCAACPLGSYQVKPGQETCLLCPPGSVTATPGQSSCSVCQPGFFTNQSGEDLCAPCAQGFVNRYSNATSCGVCGAGQEPNALQAATACQTCPKGTYSTGGSGDGPGIVITELESGFLEPLGPPINSSICVHCGPGYYAPSEGSSTCNACFPGKISGSGAEECVVCKPGFAQSLSGQSSCLPCDVNSTRDPQGLTCLCDVGFYGQLPLTETNTLANFCTPCKEGQLCDKPGLTSLNIEVQPGYWQANTTNGALVYYRCQYFTQCKGGLNSECLDNREGPLCAVCRENYFSFFGGMCFVCPKQTNSYLYLAMLAALFLIGYSIVCYLLLQNMVVLGRLERQEQVLELRRDTRSEAAKTADLIFMRDQERMMSQLPSAASSATQSRSPSRPASPQRRNRSFLSSPPIPASDSSSNLHRLSRVRRTQAARAAKQESPDVQTPSPELNVTARKSFTSLFAKKGLATPSSEKSQKLYLDMKGRPVFEPSITYKLKILIAFFQILSNLGVALELPWPRYFKQVISFFSIANLDLFQAANLDCMYPRGQVYYGKFLVILFVPFLMILLPVIFYALPHTIYNRLYRRGHHGPVDAILNEGEERGAAENYLLSRLALQRIWLKTVKLILFGLFVVYPVVSATILGIFNCKEVEGVLYLSGDFNTLCNTAEWRRHATWAYIFVVLYPFGIPALFFSLMFFTRRKPGGLRRPRALIALGILYHGYDEDKYWFELVEMLHKLLLVGFVAFVPTKYQIPTAMLILLALSLVLLLLHPYKRWTDDSLHLTAQFYIYLFLYLAMLIRIDSAELTPWNDLAFSILMLVMMAVFMLAALWTVFQFLLTRFHRWSGVSREKLEQRRLTKGTVNPLTGVDRTPGAYEPKGLKLPSMSRLAGPSLLTLAADGGLPRSPVSTANGVYNMGGAIILERKVEADEEDNDNDRVHELSNVHGAMVGESPAPAGPTSQSAQSISPASQGQDDNTKDLTLTLSRAAGGLTLDSKHSSLNRSSDNFERGGFRPIAAADDVDDMDQELNPPIKTVTWKPSPSKEAYRNRIGRRRNTSTSSQNSFSRPSPAPGGPLNTTTTPTTALLPRTSLRSSSSPESTSRGLEDQWLPQRATDTGAIFFYNVRTGESTWENPHGPVPPPKSPAGRPVPGNNPPPPPPTPAVFSPQGSDPSDWVPQQDFASKAYFFYNTRTGESRWQLPGQGEPQPPPPPATPTDFKSAPGLTLPASNSVRFSPGRKKRPQEVRGATGTRDWVPQQDPASGATFYYNARTGASQWENPYGVPPPSSPSGPPPASNFSMAGPRPPPSMASPPPMPVTPAAAASADSEWEMRQDSNTGAFFFFNIRTGQSSWADPRDSAS